MYGLQGLNNISTERVRRLTKRELLQQSVSTFAGDAHWMLHDFVELNNTPWLSSEFSQSHDKAPRRMPRLPLTRLFQSLEQLKALNTCLLLKVWLSVRQLSSVMDWHQRF